MLWSFILIFVFCESGAMVTHQFDKFDENFQLKCNWYFLPGELQRVLVVFISDVQQTKFIHGYANVVCTREAFRKVNKKYVKFESSSEYIKIFHLFHLQIVHGGFSYFMLLQNIE